MTESRVLLGGAEQEANESAISTSTTTERERPIGRRRSDRIIAASAAGEDSAAEANAAARSNLTTLIIGPSGSGKEHTARAIHAWSRRAGEPFVTFSAAGVPDSHQESELFGAAPGGEALSTGSREGALERAGNGVLFIDHLERVTPAVRSALFEAIRAQSFRSAASGNSLPLRCRVIASGDASAEGLTGDLTVHVVKLCQLEARREDILPLASHFLTEFTSEEGSTPVGFTADARRWLVEETWPGNVRELRERVRQALRLAAGGAVSAEALMLSIEGDDVPSFKEAKRAFETRYVEGLLRRCSGNISRAARLARKDRKDFYDVIRRTGVDPTEFRP